MTDRTKLISIRGGASGQVPQPGWVSAQQMTENMMRRFPENRSSHWNRGHTVAEACVDMNKIPVARDRPHIVRA